MARGVVNMDINLDYPPGATPLDADELASLIDASETRLRYIAALQAADARDYAPLIAFARS